MEENVQNNVKNDVAAKVLGRGVKSINAEAKIKQILGME
jgi:hypothetical protein